MTTETDFIWFKGNIEKIEEKFKGQFIAILDEEIIASSDNYDELSRIIVELKNSGKLK